MFPARDDSHEFVSVLFEGRVACSPRKSLPSLMDGHHYSVCTYESYTKGHMWVPTYLPTEAMIPNETDSDQDGIVAVTQPGGVAGGPLIHSTYPSKKR